ncbi:MAG: hypothetical protein QM689_08590 [Oscillospiraceae bacterium]
MKTCEEIRMRLGICETNFGRNESEVQAHTQPIRRFAESAWAM